MIFSFELSSQISDPSSKMGCSNSIQSSDLESNRIDEELRKERKLLR